VRLACAVLAATLAAATLASAADPLGPCGPIDRQYEAVELPAAQLQRLGKTPLDRLGVVAFRGGHAAPIPFQIDERRGRKVALADGSEPLEDDRPGVLDADDVLVFMVCDAGERKGDRPLEASLSGSGAVTAWREIEVRDPRNGVTAYTYLVVADTPPQTAKRYVDYTPPGDLVGSASYRVGLVNALPMYLALLRDGTPTPNLLDGPRLRVHATLLANLASFDLHEGQGQHRLVGWKAGPVRVVRRSRHYVSIGFGIELSAGVANTYFYARHVYAPGSMKLPFSPSVFFREINAIGGADGRDMQGWHYYANGVPRSGLTIDGRTSAEEKGFAADGDWFALAERDQAILFAVRLSENLAREIPLHLVYRDDAATPLPPENVPGTQPLVGFEGHHIERLQAGRYQFALHIFALPGFQPGDQRAILAGLDEPITAAVTGSESSAHTVPAARAIRSNPAATATAPMARATRSPAGATRSAVMAAATTAIAPRSMTPTIRRIAIRPAQQRTQWSPRSTPCRQAVPASAGSVRPQPGASRQHAR